MNQRTVDQATLYPCPDRPAQLLQELVDLFAGLPSVGRIAHFASQARGKGDRWSDCDLIVAVTGGEEAEWGAAVALRSRKPVLHYSPFRDDAQPSGVYVFADESIFHKVDLNFVSIIGYDSGQELTRFKHIVELYRAAAEKQLQPMPVGTPAPISLRPEEMEVGLVAHYTAKALKHCLRKGSRRQQLAKQASLLRTVLLENDLSGPSACGRLDILAKSTLEMAESVLQEKLPLDTNPTGFQG